MRHYLILFLILSLFFGNFAFAQEELVVQEFPPDSELLLVYSVHLYYDNERVVPDRDFEFKYDVIEGEYIKSSGSLSFELINKLGSVSFEGSFDPQKGDKTFMKGKLDFWIPYFADGDKIIFFDKDGNITATISVDQSSFCNDNGSCERDRGENSQSCPNDCKSIALPSSTPTASPGFGAGLIPEGLDIMSIAYIALGLIAFICLLVYIFKKLKGKKPSMPPPSSPTEPPPPSTPATDK